MSAADNWRALPADERRDLVAYLIGEGAERTLAARRAMRDGRLGEALAEVSRAAANQAAADLLRAAGGS